MIARTPIFSGENLNEERELICDVALATLGDEQAANTLKQSRDGTMPEFLDAVEGRIEKIGAAVAAADKNNELRGSDLPELAAKARRAIRNFRNGKPLGRKELDDLYEIVDAYENVINLLMTHVDDNESKDVPTHIAVADTISFAGILMGAVSHVVEHFEYLKTQPRQRR